MDLPWGDKRSMKFVSNIGLISSYGKYGHNIMACEWTHHVNYSPGVIAVCINPKNASHKNISKTKQFGISIASKDQNVVTSLAGTSTGKKLDKINYFKKLGFKFFKARKINCLMVKGACLHIECKVIKKVRLKDHTMFIGKVEDSYIKEDKDPLIYYKDKFWNIGKQIKKPNKSKRQNMRELQEKFLK